MRASKDTKLREYQKRFNNTVGICEKCGRTLPLTIEHIIPVYLLEQLGLFEETVNDVRNFALYCRYCNSFKGGRLDMLHPKTIFLLDSYIQKLKNK
jgi:5-methylcytosine-specific restriction endonuclease McrA